MPGEKEDCSITHSYSGIHLWYLSFVVMMTIINNAGPQNALGPGLEYPKWRFPRQEAALGFQTL